jgi:hypothetical protein
MDWRYRKSPGMTVNPLQPRLILTETAAFGTQHSQPVLFNT